MQLKIYEELEYYIEKLSKISEDFRGSKNSNAKLQILNHELKDLLNKLESLRYFKEDEKTIRDAIQAQVESFGDKDLVHILMLYYLPDDLLKTWEENFYGIH